MQAGTLTGFKDLDRDVLIRLSYKDLLLTCSVNKHLSQYCKNDNFWREFLQNKFPSINQTKYPYYSTWREYAEVIYTNAQRFEVPFGYISATYKEEMIKEQEDDGEVSDQTLTELYQIARRLPFINQIRRGDIVHFNDFGNYSNDGKFIYDGAHLENLSYTGLDEDGYLPVNYTLEEFIDPSRWFTLNIIIHNAIVWIDLSKPIYQLVESNSKYLVFKRDSIYYTVVPNEQTFKTANLKNDELNLEKDAYDYDVDNNRINDNPVYASIRNKVKGYVLIHLH
jgi:hypothetical protein